MKNSIKRIGAILLILMLLLSTMTAMASQSYSDLTPEHWCYKKIMQFVDKGYIDGYEDDTMRPDRTITRAEYVKVVNNFFGYKGGETSKKFEDVNDDDWYADYVYTAVAKGYISGYEDNTFRPDNPITRQEATVILSRILGIDDEEYPENHVDGLAQYSDGYEVADWAYTPIHSYSVYNFINGYEDGTLRILQNVTRAETVELLNILEQKIEIDEGGGGSAVVRKVKTPVITAYELSGESEVAVSGWVNNDTEINGGAKVVITCATEGATIYYKLNDGEEKEYTGEFYVEDGVTTITARAEMKRRADSSKTTLEVKVDTVSPKVAGEKLDNSVKILVTDNDKYNLGEENISGLNEESLKYAWFVFESGDYIRETVWTSFSNNDVVIAPTIPGIYYLGVKGEDVAENKIGEFGDFANVDDKVDVSGDVETNEPFEIVTENKKEDDVPSGDTEVSGDKTPSGDNEPSGDITPSGDKTPSGDVKPTDDPITVEVEAEVKVIHIYDEDKATIENIYTAVPGTIYEASVNADENYIVSGDLSDRTITVSRNSGDNVIEIEYTRILVTISYNGNGSTNGEMENQVIKAGNEDNLFANAFEKTGYTFIGWSTESSGEKVYDDKDEFSASSKNTEVELYAIWQANGDIKYTVEYYFETLSGDYEIDDKESEDLEGKTGVEVSAEIKSFEGFEFDEDNENNVLSGNVTGDAKLVLKVYYNRIDNLTYTVNYYLKDTTTKLAKSKVVENQKFGAEVTENAIDVDGYEKVNPTTKKLIIDTKSNEINFYYEAKTITITFKYNNGDEDKVISGDYGTAVPEESNPTKDGYEFAGWDEDIPETFPSEDMIINATWEWIAPDISATFESTNFIDSGDSLRAEPNDTIKYDLTITNNETKKDADIEIRFNEDVIVKYKDASGDTVTVELSKGESLEGITLGAGEDLTIEVSAVVPDDQEIGGDFKLKASIDVLKGSEVEATVNKTAKNEIEKSVVVANGEPKDKNITLIIDKSGSMHFCCTHNSMGYNGYYRYPKNYDFPGNYSANDIYGNYAYHSYPFIGHEYKNDSGDWVRCTDTKSRIEIVQEALTSFVTTLTDATKKNGEDITITIVTFNNSASAGTTYTFYASENNKVKIDSINEDIENISAINGTNIKDGINKASGVFDRSSMLEDADNYVIFFGDGNGTAPSTKECNNLLAKVDSAYAIGFGPDFADSESSAYEILERIVGSKGSVTQASTAADVLAAFSDIAKAIANSTQSSNGLVNATLPADGLYYPIYFKYTSGDSVETLFTITTTADLETYSDEVTIANGKLTWDISGTKYSDYTGLRVELTTGDEATNGEVTESQENVEEVTTNSGNTDEEDAA